MMKCNFCTECNQNGKCIWEQDAPSYRKYFCKKAIKRMEKAFKHMDIKQIDIKEIKK